LLESELSNGARGAAGFRFWIGREKIPFPKTPPFFPPVELPDLRARRLQKN